jgi:hypothetical protein
MANLTPEPAQVARTRAFAPSPWGSHGRGKIGSEPRNPAHSAAPCPGEAPVQVVDDITDYQQNDDLGYAGIYGDLNNREP